MDVPCENAIRQQITNDDNDDGSTTEDEPLKWDLSKQQEQQQQELKRKAKPKQRFTENQQKRRKIVKGPISAWIYFLKSKQKLFPDIKWNDLCQQFKIEWHNMSFEDKKPFITLEKRDARRYEQKKLNLNPQDKKELKETRRKKTQKNHIKPILTLYNVHVRFERQRLKPLHPDKSWQEIGRMVGESWKTITEEQKQVYRQIVEEDRLRYQQEKEKTNQDK